MPLSWNEIRQRAIAFSRDWADAARERSEAQTFWNEFFHVFGRSRRAVANFEETVRNTRGGRDFIDLLWPGVLIAEHKSRGRDLDKAHTQAVDYINELVNDGREDQAPRYIVVSDFARLAIHDLTPPDDAEPHDVSFEFPVADLHQHIHRFAFVAGYETRTLDPEDPANLKAAELLANLHDRLEDGGYTGHDLQRFMVRVLFCLFAEDTELFDTPEAFRFFILHHTRDDGSDLGAQLSHLFQVLNTPRDRRQANLNEDLAALPYVNGELFAENLNITAFDSAMREALLTCCGFKWNQISPAIFGSLFQSIMEPKERRQIGAHYTSERDILKLINSLFLDELKADFEKAKKTSKPELRRFHEKLAGLKFLDPACGCGNFLVIAYRELRELELKVLEALHPAEGLQTTLSFELADALKVQVSQMHGIEIEEWPARIAEVALWLLDHQMNLKVSATFGQLFKKLPLRHSPHIAHANALQLDWNDVLPAAECDYVMGNPPFIGSKYQTKEQRAEVRDIWGDIRGVGTLDYVSAWYAKAADYMLTHGRASFVSTNSITQGEQVGVIWPELFKRGIKIHHGHRTFPWTSEARGMAHVHVVIVGFGHGEPHTEKRIHDYGPKGEVLGIATVANISPYLADGSDRAVTSRSTPLMDVSEIRSGNQPIDGGAYLFELDEKLEFLNRCPAADPYFKRWIDGRDLINGTNRWLLWLGDAEPNFLRAHSPIKDIVERVKAFRLVSKRTATQKLAATPTRFQVETFPTSNYLAIPEVSSERRDYIPILFLSPQTICSNKIRHLVDATLYDFGILTSAMHMAWVNEISGRLKSDYQWSIKLVYNNFPWPEATEAQRGQVEAAARGVLDARENHPDATLADLYDPLTMPADLAKAHAALDRAVDRCYRPQPFPDERRRFEHLFELYEKLVAPLTGGGKKRKRRG
jgi:hypothetical protein